MFILFPSAEKFSLFPETNRMHRYMVTFLGVLNQKGIKNILLWDVNRDEKGPKTPRQYWEKPYQNFSPYSSVFNDVISWARICRAPPSNRHGFHMWYSTVVTCISPRARGHCPNLFPSVLSLEWQKMGDLSIFRLLSTISLNIDNRGPPSTGRRGLSPGGGGYFAPIKISITTRGELGGMVARKPSARPSRARVGLMFFFQFPRWFIECWSIRIYSGIE